jgi:hypothetical protein
VQQVRYSRSRDTAPAPPDPRSPPPPPAGSPPARTAAARSAGVTTSGSSSTRASAVARFTPGPRRAAPAAHAPPAHRSPPIPDPRRQHHLVRPRAVTRRPDQLHQPSGVVAPRGRSAPSPAPCRSSPPPPHARPALQLPLHPASRTPRTSSPSPGSSVPRCRRCPPPRHPSRTELFCSAIYTPLGYYGSRPHLRGAQGVASSGDRRVWHVPCICRRHGPQITGGGAKARPKKGFRYIGVNGRRLTSEATLARIRALGDPAGVDGRAHLAGPDRKIQVWGRDQAGRKQYRYSAGHVASRTGGNGGACCTSRG